MVIGQDVFDRNIAESKVFCEESKILFYKEMFGPQQPSQKYDSLEKMLLKN